MATRQEWACGNACFNGVTRTVWDGDQVLHELRAPMAAAERDTGQVPIGTQSAPLYGQVAYMFGAQLDRPLLVYRMNYDTLFPGVHRIVPHSNWGGSFDTGTIDGLRDKDAPCLSFPMVPEDEQQYPDTYMGGIDRGPGRDSVKLCMAVDWPAAYLWRNHLSRQNSAYGARSWMGSLIQNKRDETGQLYMRHRFYDPQTGRFTQEDPIGLAGGLNAYGFANGDPVGYSDPYGLSACPYPPCRDANDPMKDRPLPPGIDDKDVTWDPEEEWYVHDKDGRVIRPHGEDAGHWDHWEVYPGAGGRPTGRGVDFPEKNGKLRPGQKRPPYGKQSPTDPWSDVPGAWLYRTRDEIGDAVEGMSRFGKKFLRDFLEGFDNLPTIPGLGGIPILVPIPIP